MAEDYELCTFQKHHKQKILLFLSAMRSHADSLKKNKDFIPSFVSTLAKPLYQVSIIKLYLQKYFFNRAEVLSEHKWVDLPKNKRFIIGSLTFILIIIYSIYIIYIVPRVYLIHHIIIQNLLSQRSSKEHSVAL